MTEVLTFRLTQSGVELLDLPATTLDQASLQLPQGTYTTFRTYQQNRIVRLEAYLVRLDESNRLLGYDVPLDRTRIRDALAEVLARTDYRARRSSDSRLRITVGLAGGSAEVFISLEPFRPWPVEWYEHGVKAITIAMVQSNPRAKSTSFIAPSRQLQRSLPPDVHEVLMISPDGAVLEGFTSNFFAVKGGTLYTAGEGVLEGITRALVLEIAAEVMRVQLEPVRLSEVPTCAEAFITSASREIMPVVSIDSTCVGDSQRGLMTRELLRRYRERIRDEAQPAV
jgi:branched-chain amino acid aminotransferase